MRRAGILCLAGIVFCALFSVSAVVAADLASIIRQRYETLKSFSAEFEQTLTHKESGSVERRRGSLLFQKPLLIRWQTAKPHEETLVVTAKEIWDYLPDEEVAYRYPPSLVRDSRSIIQVITGQAALTKDFEVKPEGDEQGLARLRLYPKEPAPQMVEALIWVEPDSGCIRRASIVDFYGNTNEVRFLSFKADARLNAADFSFTPPRGIDVEDRIDRDVPERELFK
ncbi:outer membrane lipoprotein chaperone LolA [Desulfovibrio sp. SGI.169]|uniref:outer membrane lipoprotein chaperone LolA n=1 Tax=Desulfovibrio sp. SGI.169 TaxID=3420561 RepID=UPI003CFD7DCF